MNLEAIKPKLLPANEKFKIGNSELSVSLADFWAWNQSALLENRNRGILAEFIVKTALGIVNETRVEWDAYDFITEDRVKVEVKSAAYIQAWRQNKLSTIQFNIAPRKTWFDENKYSETAQRNADIYIFCLLHEKNQEIADPLQLEQWTFYICLTKNLPQQKTISLSSIASNKSFSKCNYSNLNGCFTAAKGNI